jgi:hypothetical protein
VVVVETGLVVVVAVGEVVLVVVASELPLLDRVKLNPNAISATTISTPASRAKPARRHRQDLRTAAWRASDMAQSYFGAENASPNIHFVGIGERPAKP